jgi:hypothetical protein
VRRVSLEGWPDSDSVRAFGPFSSSLCGMLSYEGQGLFPEINQP